MAPSDDDEKEQVGVSAPISLLEEVDQRTQEGDRSEWVTEAIKLRLKIDGWYEERGEIPGLPSDSDIQQIRQSLDRIEQLKEDES